MDHVGFLIKGLVIGLAIAAPVGPIGVLCIRRTLVEGRLVGLVTGMGAATTDGLYGAVAAFGLTAISDLLIGNGLWLGRRRRGVPVLSRGAHLSCGASP